MYSISNFQVCDIVLLIIATMLYIKLPKLDSSHNWKFELFDQYLPIYLTSQSLTLYTFFFLMKFHTVFHIFFHHDCANFHSNQQYMKVPFSTSSQTLAVCLFDESHSDKCEVIFYYDFNLHCLMISDAKYLFIYLMSISVLT